MNKTQLIDALEKQFPTIHILPDSTGWVAKSDTSFAVSAEHYSFDSRGYDLLNYWTENYEHYELGVSNELVSFLDDAGWYAEWVNPGVVAIVKD
jgi:hypothetical protein